MTSVAASDETPRTCRLCHAAFLPRLNTPSSCRHHPESYTGETAQRWLAPGDKEHRNDIHFFYTCCGQALGSSGCCYSPHVR